MTSSGTKICAALFCIVTLAPYARALGGAEAAALPSNPEIAKELDAGKYVRASEGLKKMLSKNPNDAQASFWLARCFLEMGDYENAIPYAEQAVRLAPGRSEPHLWLARAYGLKAEKSRSFLIARKSRQEFETAVQLDPNNLLARRNLMEFYLEAPWYLGGSKDRAWNQAEAIASRDPVSGYLARGDYWRELGKPSLAEQNYRQALELKPQSAGPYFQVADFCEFDRDPELLEAAVHAASVVEPNDVRLAYYRGVVRVLKGKDLPEAQRYLEEYLSRAPQRDDFPPHASAHDWLGRIYERWGKVREAIQQYKTALELSSDNQPALDGLRRLESN
jgi:tetratricopeptide (TPR) repeat protein